MVANATTHSWAVESVSMAMAQVYPYFQSKNVVDQSYQDAMRALCRSQVAIAGYRLADLIASIYG